MSPDLQQNLVWLLFTYPLFLFCLSFHEMAHAITAAWGGDQTSAYQGRVTMNPIAHIDPIGTVLIPLLGAIFSGIPLIGWAKPVPVVETNFRRGSNYGMVVAMAGPFSNILLALAGVALMQIWVLTQTLATIPDGTANTIDMMLWYFIVINLVLAFFNMIPIPPLDGSHLVWHLYAKNHPRAAEAFVRLSKFSYLILMALIYLGFYQFYLSKTVEPISKVLMNLAYLPLHLIY